MTVTKEQQARTNGHRLKLAVARIHLRTDKRDLARELLKTHGYIWEKEGAQWVLYAADHVAVGVGQEAVVRALEMMEACITDAGRERVSAVPAMFSHSTTSDNHHHRSV